MKADLSNLFVLDEAFTKDAVRAGFASSSRHVGDWAAATCAGSILTQSSGRTLCDLVGTTRAGLYLLSQRVRDALKREMIAGWRAYPVDFRGSNGEPLSQYAAIGVIGRCGPLENERSKKVTRLLPAASSSADSWIGLYFREDTWDGADLFRPYGTMLTIATSRAKEVIEKIGATNIRFRPLLKVERAVL